MRLHGPGSLLLSLLALPLFAGVFEANRGQTAPDVLFVARDQAGPVYVRRDGWSVVANGRAARFRFANARSVTPEAVEPLASRSNYFIGKDPSRWIREVPHFGAVRYRNVYRGIDAVLHHDNGSLEYDFIVAPHIDPGAIAIDVDGALQLGNGLVQRKPVAFQTIDGTRHNVDVSYALHGHRISFVVGDYDRAHPLTIDPEITFSTFFGGSNDDIAYVVAVDDEGSAYFAGATYSLDLPLKTPYQSTNKSSPTTEDAFVAKFNASGALVYSTYLGGQNGYDRITAIAVDKSGYAYVGGETHTLQFPTTPGAFQTTGNPRVGSDGFLTRLTPNGNQLVFSTYLAATNTNVNSTERMKAIAVLPNSEIYFAMTTEHPSFPMTPGAFISNGCGSVVSGVVGKLNASGSTLLASTYMCGGLWDTAEGLALDSAGNVYVAGSFSSNPFPYNAPSKIASKGFDDSYVAKLNPGLTQLLGLAGFGGFFSEWTSDIAIDDEDNIWVSGKTRSNDFSPLVAPTQPTFGGAENCMTRSRTRASQVCGDAFLVKLDPSMNFVFSTYIGGLGDDEITQLAIGAGGRVYASGTTTSANFPSVASPFGPFRGQWDALLGSFLPNGKTEWLGPVGGSDREEGISVATGPGAVWMVGWTASQAFPTQNAFKSVLGNLDEDAFVMRVTTPLDIPRRRAVRR